MAGRRKATAEQAQPDTESREAERDEHSAQDDQHHDDGEGEGPDQDDGEDGDGSGLFDPEPEHDTAAEDFAAISNVDHDAEPEDGIALGSAQLTARQTTGLDPVDPSTHVRQHGEREGLTNAQTAHEASNALDPISGTPNPGVTDTVRHSVPGKAGANDMSGKPALPDPFANLDTQGRAVMSKLTKASKEAHARGRAAGQGFVCLRDLGVHKAVMDALVASGIVHQATRPGGEFSPETGTVYRIASHDE